MKATMMTNAVLADHLLPRSLTRNVLLVVGGSLALWLSAKVQVPFWPVPMTMQTFVVLVLGMALGPRVAGAAVMLYLAQGAAGLPVFAGTPERGIGVAYMVGPTGGYLLGFLLAAITTGVLAERGWSRNILSAFAALLIGTAIIYALGLLWLGAVIGWDKNLFAIGVAPFLAAEAFKVALAAAVLPLTWRLIKR
ncbi:MAG: biotin transporter BioY [Pseudomonadota bacterium]